VALTATIYTFEIDLADHDRGRFESLALRVAKHPSESEEYLWTRVLAYALEYEDGIEFSKGGISDPDDPAIGAPMPRAERIEIFAIDRTLIARLVPLLARRVAITLSVSDRELYVSIGSESLVGRKARLSL
jgi:uncharacterized protein YaeQ